VVQLLYRERGQLARKLVHAWRFVDGLSCAGRRSRRVRTLDLVIRYTFWAPQNAEWFDMFSGQKLQVVDNSISYKLDLDTFGLLVKAGSIIPSHSLEG